MKAVSSQSVTKVPSGEIKDLIAAALRRRDVDDLVAQHLTEALVETSLRGVDSHGIRLFPHYVRALEAGRINGRPAFQFKQTAPSTGTLDADDTFGHAAGVRAMREAMRLASESGLGAVSVSRSSHSGAAACYALMAAREDLIGMSFTHADSLMLSPGSTRPFFGTNPVCVAVPVEGEDPFCHDMATTMFTWNKVKMHREKDQPLPPGIAADEKGDPETDPHRAACLFPIGDYKGFGLGFVVDILCGLLAGMPFGRDISSMYLDPITQKRNLGQFYLCLDPARFTDPACFKQRMKDEMDRVRREPRRNNARPVMVPGDPEKICLKDRLRNGIPLNEALLATLKKLAAE